VSNITRRHLMKLGSQRGRLLLRLVQRTARCGDGWRTLRKNGLL
jgi:hypothetical protein